MGAADAVEVWMVDGDILIGLVFWVGSCERAVVSWMDGVEELR